MYVWDPKDVAYKEIKLEVDKVFTSEDIQGGDTLRRPYRHRLPEGPLRQGGARTGHPHI